MAGIRFKALSRFPKVFWVSQIFELLERGAYYTMIPIITVHCYYNVGLPVWLSAMITAFMYPIQYGLPILSGAMGERIGYRKQITFSFVVLTIGYLLLFIAFNAATMILAVVVVGLGIGSYKPLISSVVAKSTSGQERNLAYSIYYWVVNLGAFVFPTIYVILEFYGFISRPTYYYVFLVGAVMVSLNIFIALFFFEDPPRSESVKTVRDAVRNIKIALIDKKFLIMVVLNGGFWALYSSTLNALPIVLFGFKLVPWWFTAMMLGVFNPLTIILLGMPIGRYTERIESLKVLMAGVLLYIVGLAIIGYTLQWVWVVVGIVVSSIGEFMAAPGYLSFISKLAPKEKVSAYIGCNFISNVIGLVGGTFFFGLLVTIIAVDWGMPYFFYGVLTVCGIGVLMGFMLYYHLWGQEIAERGRLMRELEGEEEALWHREKEPLLFRMFDYKVTMIIAAGVIPIILVSSYSMGTLHFYGTEEEPTIEVFDPSGYKVSPGPVYNLSGHLTERDSANETLAISVEKDRLLKSVTFTLTWRDEEDIKRFGISPRTWENQPDKFKLSVSYNGVTKEAEGENVHGEEGKITLSFEISHQTQHSTNGTGEWSVSITLETAGDYSNPLSPITYVDDGNDYALKVNTDTYVVA